MQPATGNTLDRPEDKRPPEEYFDLMRIWQAPAYGKVVDDYESNFMNNTCIKAVMDYSACVTMILDLRTQEFSFISSNVEAIFGYGKSNFFENGLKFCNKIAHPEDLHRTWKLLKKIWGFLLTVPSGSLAQYKFNYDYRIERPDGKEVRILAQNSVLQLDSHGNITHVLGIYSDISHWKKSEEQIGSIVSRVNDTCFFISPDMLDACETSTVLSKRELEIVKLMAEGYSSKIIADKLSISFHTVNTHRQKILEKTKALNTGGLVQFACSRGLI